MPIYHPIEQRSADWYYLRLGKPTASEFDQIITPAKGLLSAQHGDYIRFLLAELMLGKPLDSVETAFMTRGEQLEDEAIEAYEVVTGMETQRGGFVTDDLGQYGCSPDRLVGDVGLLEMKVPAPQTHVGYLLNPESLDSAKRCQVQGQLLVTERAWVDLVSYHPEMPIVVRRVKRDQAFIGMMRMALVGFMQSLREARLKLEREYGPFRPIVKPEPAEPQETGSLGVSEADVEYMMQSGAIRTKEF